MTLTPLAPMQGPQAQQPGQLPDVPAPMDTAQAPAVQTAQPWHSDVVANFQQAHATLDPMSYGLASGLIGVSPVNPIMPSRGYGITVIPGDTGESTGSGGNWQPGPNATAYGGPQGDQTQGYAPTTGRYSLDDAGNVIPVSTSPSSTPVPDYFGTGTSGINRGDVDYTPPITGGALPGGVSTSGTFLPGSSSEVGQTTAEPGVAPIAHSGPTTPVDPNSGPIPSLWNPDGTPYEPPVDPQTATAGVWTGSDGGGGGGGGD